MDVKLITANIRQTAIALRLSNPPSSLSSLFNHQHTKFSHLGSTSPVSDG